MGTKSILTFSFRIPFYSSHVVPFDKITDCDLEEPAGNTCFCIPNILTKVNIDTASSGGPEGQKELKIVGLKDPHSFKKLVWAMKRAQQQVGGTPMMGMHQSPPAAFSMMGRNGDSSNDENNNVASLLREIRDELRNNNDLLQKLKPEEASAVLQQQQQPVVSAPLQDLLR
jgi:hypothetical protein